MEMQDNLLTVSQMATYLSVDKFTVYRLIAQKKIPAFKVGNQWRFNKKMVESWLERNSNVRKKGAH